MAVRQGEAPAVALRDRARDRQAEAEAAGLRPGAVAAHEGLQHRGLLALRNARSLVQHLDGDLVQSDLEAHRGAAAVLDGVLDQVGEGALQLIGGAPHQGRTESLGPHRLADIREAVADGLDQGGEVDERQPLAGAPVADEREGGLHQGVHLVEVAQELRPEPLVLQKFGAQAQAGDRRAQVVADRRQHVGAVVDQALDPPAHPVEGAAHRQHLLGALLGQRREVHAGAEGLRRTGEARERRRQRPGGPDRQEGERQGEEEQRAQDGAGERRRAVRPGRQVGGEREALAPDDEAGRAVVPLARAPEPLDRPVRPQHPAQFLHLLPGVRRTAGHHHAVGRRSARGSLPRGEQGEARTGAPLAGRRQQGGALARARGRHHPDHRGEAVGERAGPVLDPPDVRAQQQEGEGEGDVGGDDGGDHQDGDLAGDAPRQTNAAAQAHPRGLTPGSRRA